MKNIKLIVAILSTVLIFTSCEKFLEEKDMSTASIPGFYKTYDGLENLINACYADLRYYNGQEEGYDFSDVGTDAVSYAAEHPLKEQFTYSSDFNSTNPRLTVMWFEFYKALNSCNEAIEVLEGDENPFPDLLTKTRLGEAKTLRSYYLYMIVETWGNVVLKNSPSRGATTSSERSQISEFYTQIFSDLDDAVILLQDGDNRSATEFGRITKWAALGFRSRMHLTWASYLNSGFSISGNELVAKDQAAAATHYQKARDDAGTVITDGGFQLWTDPVAQWHFDNFKNYKSVIWAVNYSRDEFANFNPEDNYSGWYGAGQKNWDLREGGHHGHLMWGNWYNNFAGFMRTNEDGRGFRRYFPNAWLIDSYDETIDQRWGLFRTVWLANNPTGKVPLWLPADPPPHDSLALKPMYAYGDTGIVMYKHSFPDSLQLTKGSITYHKKRGYMIYDYDMFYNADGTTNEGPSSANHNMFYALNKFYDPERLAPDGTGSQRGIRDDYIIRLSEMYLIAAEAELMLDNKQGAYDYLKSLGDARAIGGDGTALLAAYGMNGPGNVDLDFILDERARELVGEHKRWFDLKRTQTLVSRLQMYAGQQSTRDNIREYHMLRPVPQAELDAISNAAEFGQNPGY